MMTSGTAFSPTDRAARFVGATQGQVPAQNFNRIPSWEVSGILTEARLSLERGENHRSQVHLTTTFGREVWLDCRLVPLSVGKVRHVLLMFEDVTERELAEAEARRHGRTIESMNRLFREAWGAGRRWRWTWSWRYGRAGARWTWLPFLRCRATRCSFGSSFRT